MVAGVRRRGARRPVRPAERMVVGYFDNSNGVFPGDDVRILGVPVGKVEKIEPEPERVKISFWFDDKYKVPADVNAVILSPQLVTGRAIQLTPAYTAGPDVGRRRGDPAGAHRGAGRVGRHPRPTSAAHRTAAAHQAGRREHAGEFVNTAADNLRGQGATIRDTVIKLSQALSALGDHSKDLFATFKNLSTLVSALHDSTDLLAQLNQNLAAVTACWPTTRTRSVRAVEDLNAVVGDLQSFVADNREALGTTSDKLASITTALVESLDDIKQTLHLAPTTFQNFSNIYRAGQGCVHRRAGGQQLRQPDRIPLRSDSGRVPHGRRAIREAVRAVPGADREEPPVQLPAVGFEPLRRSTGQAQRGHLQRGLDAARLRSAGRRRRPLRHGRRWPPPHRPTLRHHWPPKRRLRTRRPRRSRPIPPPACPA